MTHFSPGFITPSGPIVPFSLSLNGTSQYLYKTGGTAGNLDKHVARAIVKRGSTGSLQVVMAAGSSANTGELRFNADDTISWFVKIPSGTGHLQTTATYTSTTEWYDIQGIFDSGQATAANRMSLYIDGTKVTSFATETYPALNANGYFTSDETWAIGSSSDTFGTKLFNGNIADVLILDNSNETPTNIYGPKDTSGLTFGTQGARFDFADSGNLGNCVAGNLVDYTNAGSATQSTDSPG